MKKQCIVSEYAYIRTCVRVSVCSRVCVLFRRCSVRDLYVDVLAEKKLEESEKKYRRIFIIQKASSPPDGYNFLCLYVNFV